MREYPTSPEVMGEFAAEWDSGPSRNTQRVREVLDTLPEPLMAVFNAVFHERLSKREAARVLGIHRVEVDRRLQKIAAAVREVFGDDSEETL